MVQKREMLMVSPPLDQLLGQKYRLGYWEMMTDYSKGKEKVSRKDYLSAFQLEEQQVELHPQPPQIQLLAAAPTL